MSVSIISFRDGQLSSYCFGNIYNDDQVLTTLDMGYNPAADCPFPMVEFAQQKLKPTVFGIANAYAQSLEGILGMGLSLEKYIEGEHLNLSKGITYVTYSTKDEFGIAHKLLEKYHVDAIIIKEQTLIALSCEYTDDIIDECLSVMMEMRECDSYADKTYLKDLTLKAVQLSKSVVTDAEAISQLGEGWTAEEAWAISLYCVLRHINSVKDAIIAAVNHNGDSDSTGSVTGNIMGAIYGYDIIKKTRMFCPEGKCFEETLELHDIILALADDLYSGCIISEYSSIDTPEKKQWYGRYCKMKPLM